MPKSVANKARATKVETADVIVSAVSVDSPIADEEKITTNTLVPVMSMVREGKLVYTSTRSAGYRVVWNSYGDIQRISIDELVAMRGTDVAFFRDGWVAIPDSYDHKDAVLEYIGAKQFYKDMPNIETVTALFDYTIPKMVSAVEAMSDNGKAIVYDFAKRAIDGGELDSRKRIAALESALGKSLT